MANRSVTFSFGPRALIVAGNMVFNNALYFMLEESMGSFWFTSSLERMVESAQGRFLKQASRVR